MIRKIKNNSEIVAISNKYKDILNNFINSSSSKSLNQPRLMNKKLYNAFRSKNNLIDLFKRNCLNKNISDKSS